MILAIDVGNTNIVIGCIDQNKAWFVERLSTVRTKTELEYAVDIKTVLDLYSVDLDGIEGSIISSVVPQITGSLKLAVEKVLKKMPLVLGPGLKTGLNILMDNPATVGADLVAAAVAGIALYTVPLILIDMGTATTVTVVDEKKRYIGGLIYPGIGISLDALTSHAAQLAGISLEAPRRVIGKNTADSMRNGILYSNAAALDGIIDRIEGELGVEACRVATGGLAKKVVSLCRKEIILDEELILKGLFIIYERNRV
ncbi:MAG: type III pantothenate kinase [Blautia sp.]|nr:type III pantothenate kinase [Blautia sp.]